MNLQENPIVRTHITFVESLPNPKTRVWRVHPRNAVGYDTSEIGCVAWYGRWRKYAFFPAPFTVFEQVCLREIAAFCEEATRAHKAQRRQQSSAAFTLLELLCVISVIAILLAMAVPSVARAYRATAARAAWVEFWHSAQIVAMSADVLPPSMDPALMPPDEAWAQTYQMIGSTPRYADVSWETIRMLRESTAILGRPVNTKGTP